MSGTRSTRKALSRSKNSMKTATGTSRSQSNTRTGKRTRRLTKAKGKEQIERVEFYENEKLARVEVDENGDGRPDLWNIHAPSGELIRQEQDSDHNGTIDTWIDLDPKTKKELAVRRDTDGDQKIDSWRKNGRDGSPGYALEEDRNRDEKVDRKVSFTDGKARELRRRHRLQRQDRFSWHARRFWRRAARRARYHGRWPIRHRDHK